MKKIWDWLFPEYYVVKAFTDSIELRSYEILYSEKLNKYKLRIKGFRAKATTIYTEKVVPAFNELIKNKNNG